MYKPDSRPWLLAVVAALAWIFIVYFHYYVVHKPFDLQNVLAILNVVVDVAVWLALLGLAWAVGRRILARLAFTSRLEEAVFAVGLGLGLISLGTLALGLTGLLWRPLFWGWLLAGLGLAAWSNWRNRQQTTSRPGPLLSRPATRLERGLALYLALTLGLAFLSALTPPVAWDSQVYHLTGPRLYLEQGRIGPPPDIPYLSFPSLVEMLFLAGMLLKGEVVAKLLHFSYGLLTLAALFSLTRRYLDERTAWLASAVLYAVPSLVLVSTWAYVDLGLAFYALAAFYAVVNSREADRHGWFLLAGIMAGLAAGVKYTGAIIPVVLLPVVAFPSKPASRPRQYSLVIGHWSLDRSLVIGSVIDHWSLAIVSASPWYLRNWLFTGNPFYPFLFGGPYWDDFRAWWFGRWGTGLASDPWRLLIAPWEMTVYGSEGKLVYEATLGPALLALLPLLILVWKGNRVITWALLFAGGQYLFWLAGVAGSKLLMQSRLLLPAFAPLSLAVAYTVERLRQLDRPAFSLRRFVLLLLVLTLGLNLVSFGLAFLADNPLPYLVGLETRQAYLSRHLGGYDDVMRYVNALPPSARVLFLWEPRSYYARRQVLPDAILDRWAHLRHRYGDAEGVARYLRAEGVTHVLLSRQGLNYLLTSGYDPIGPEDVSRLAELVREYLEPVYGSPSLELAPDPSGRVGLVQVEEEPYAVFRVR